MNPTEKHVGSKEPVHLIQTPGDKYSLCKVKDPMPVVWVAAAPAHRYPCARCVACYTQAGLDWMLAMIEGQGTLL